MHLITVFKFSFGEVYCRAYSWKSHIYGSAHTKQFSYLAPKHMLWVHKYRSKLWEMNSFFSMLSKIENDVMI